MGEVAELPSYIGAAAAALCGVIGVLYRNIVQMHKDQKTMLRNQADIREEIGKLKGQQEGIERLSADVLETVHKVLNRHKSNNDPFVAKFKNENNSKHMPNHGRDHARKLFDDEY